MKTTHIKTWRSSVKIGFLGTLLMATVAASAGGDVTGVWMSEPALGQLGYVQNTYTFKKDGKFSLKMDFKSFCGMGAVTPDCEYFWMVFEGDYLLSGNSLVLNTTKGQDIQQRKGEPKPIVRDDTLRGENRQSFEYVANGRTLTLIARNATKPNQLVLTRQP
jgi:hypothetical protein